MHFMPHFSRNIWIRKENLARFGQHFVLDEYVLLLTCIAHIEKGFSRVADPHDCWRITILDLLQAKLLHNFLFLGGDSTRVLRRRWPRIVLVVACCSVSGFAWGFSWKDTIYQLLLKEVHSGFEDFVVNPIILFGIFLLISVSYLKKMFSGYNLFHYWILIS